MNQTRVELDHFNFYSNLPKMRICGESSPWRLSAIVPLTTKEATPDEAGPGAVEGRLMFFLMRMTFWFSLVLLMLPFGGGDDGSQVSPLKALMTVREAVGDIAGICERKPDVCETGKSALHTIGVRAKASAKVAYDMLGEPDESIKTGTVAKDAVADMIAKAETAAPAE